MPRYLYQARDGKGVLADGVVIASTLDAAGQSLRAEGKYIISLRMVHEEEIDPQISSVHEHARHVRRTDVIFFAHQLSIMIETGVPIAEALDCLSLQTGNPHFREVILHITDHVRAGGELSNALKKFPKLFPPIMVSLTRASEISGTMAHMLQRISTYLTKEERARRQVRGALAYPCMMVAFALSVTIFLLIFVLPRFAKIYESRQAVLPGPTRFLMGLSNLFVYHWELCLTVAGTLSLLGVLAWFTFDGKRFLDWLKLHLPIVRNLYTQLYLSRSCRALGTMISSGVAMLDAIAITRQVTPNYYYEQLWEQVDDSLKRGLQLSDPFNASPYIPRAVVQMIRSGEKSGRLPEVLHRLAEHTEEEFDSTVQNTTKFIEPVMVILMGCIIGFVAVALLLPIFNVGRVVSGGG